MRPGEKWNRYWFRNGHPQSLAICRISVVAIQLVHLAWIDIAGRIKDVDSLAAAYRPLPVLELLAGPFGGLPHLPGPALLALYCGLFVVGASAIIGFRTRTSLLLFGVGGLFFHGYFKSFGFFDHADGLVLIATLLLACAPAGQVLSLDARARRLAVRGGVAPDPSRPVALWPLLLIRWLLVLVYLSAFMSKVLHGGVDWVNGYTLQYITYVKGVALSRPLGVWLSEQHFLCVLLSWGTLLFEGSFCLALLRRRLTAVYIVFGILFHTSIELTMGASFFEFLALYTAFLEREVINARSPIFLRVRSAWRPSS